VEQFAEDLRAVLDCKPIRARARDRIYRARKLAARRPLALLLGAGIAAMAVGGAALWPRSRPVAAPTLTAKRLTANTSELPIHSAAISPDGKRIAYSDALGIHVRDAATGATRLLPQTAGHVATHWMSGGAALLATIQNGASQQAVAAPLAGGAPTPLPEEWVYSPDGKLRAVSREGPARLVVERADGAESRQIWQTAADRNLDDFAWSPNGREIAILSSRANSVAGSTLEVVDVVRGRKSVLLTDAGKFLLGGVVWMDASRIVVCRDEITGNNSYNSNLWEARLNARRELATAGLRALTQWTDLPIQPRSLTTDGKRIVFVRNFAQRDVYVARVDALRWKTESPRRLTLDLGDDYPTAWTPDGKSVILTSDRSGEVKIYRQRLDRQEAEPVVNWPGRQMLPRLSPDRRSLLFCNMIPKDRTCRLMRAPLDGGTPTLVDTIPQIGDFRCSPAGPCTISQRNTQGLGFVVFELDLAKGKGREIYRETDGLSGNPDLSPDGKWLAAVSGSKVVLRSFRTGAVAREMQVPGVRRLMTLDYAPDGRGFYVGEFLATEARQFYVDLAGRATLLWTQPGTSLIWSIPSPDGKALAMLMYTTDANVYMVDGF
jgi:Tol biopolymer transport system component